MVAMALRDVTDANCSIFVGANIFQYGIKNTSKTGLKCGRQRDSLEGRGDSCVVIRRDTSDDFVEGGHRGVGVAHLSVDVPGPPVDLAVADVRYAAFARRFADFAAGCYVVMDK